MAKDEEILSFVVPVPKIGAGKAKNQLVLANNMPVWYRYHKTRIKEEFKHSLVEWLIPKSNLLLESLKIEFSLIRHNNRRIDSDAPFFIFKWIIDTIVEQGYAKDDNKVKLVIIPSIVDKAAIETSIKVRVSRWIHQE